MDGFVSNEGVIVLGATNRSNDLDKALLRPGRFDTQVEVPAPDMKGRSEILTLYLGNKTWMVVYTDMKKIPGWTKLGENIIDVSPF